jgi:hypothetical protein
LLASIKTLSLRLLASNVRLGITVIGRPWKLFQAIVQRAITVLLGRSTHKVSDVMKAITALLAMGLRLRSAQRGVTAKGQEQQLSLPNVRLGTTVQQMGQLLRILLANCAEEVTSV